MHGHLNVKFKLFKNHNRMQGVGTGGGVKDGWKSEICSGMCIINMLSSGWGDNLWCTDVWIYITTNYVQKKNDQATLLLTSNSLSL